MNSLMLKIPTVYHIPTFGYRESYVPVRKKYAHSLFQIEITGIYFEYFPNHSLFCLSVGAISISFFTSSHTSNY